jgi:NFU1 iron-sulfur cluster scaffold homolog, mitochondrial
MGFEVKEVQSTPNPNALKFVLDRAIAPQPISFFKAESAAAHSLAARLFKIGGVASLLLLGDFVTVNKQPQAKWSAITKKVRKILAEA